MDYADPKRKGNFVGKVFLAAALTTLCIIMIKRSPSLNSPSPVIPITLLPLKFQHHYHCQCTFTCASIMFVVFVSVCRLDYIVYCSWSYDTFVPND